MKLLYATANKAKFDLMKDYVEPLDIQLTSLQDYCLDLQVDESGRFPDENARIKALAYFKALRTPLFACDTGLFFENIPIELQPGVHVRRVNGKVLTDSEMTEYYSALAVRFGGNLIAQYNNAICLMLSETEIYVHAQEDIASEKFIITNKAHPIRTEGFPIDCLSIDIKTGEYYLDQKGFRCVVGAKGFQDFFIKALKLKCVR